MRRPRAVGRFVAAAGVVVAASITVHGPTVSGVVDGNTRSVATGARDVERLAWLAGCWEGTLSSGASYEEVWLAPRGGSIIGMSRMTRDGRTLSFEFMRIGANAAGDVVYAAQPSGRPATHFTASELSSNAVTFENPEHDFPQRILYRLTPPDELFARIEGQRDGQLRGLDFPLRRVACAG
jgi:hypothetical protein